MSAPRKLSITAMPDFYDAPAITAHQIASVAEPRLMTELLIGTESVESRSVRRPWVVWKDDLSFPRTINEGLAGEP